MFLCYIMQEKSSLTFMHCHILCAKSLCNLKKKVFFKSFFPINAVRHPYYKTTDLICSLIQKKASSLKMCLSFLAHTQKKVADSPVIQLTASPVTQPAASPVTQLAANPVTQLAASPVT